MGKNTQVIKEYIANQLKEDEMVNQMTLEDIGRMVGKDVSQMPVKSMPLGIASKKSLKGVYAPDFITMLLSLS